MTPIAHIPFLKLLGVEQEVLSPGHAMLRLPEVRDEFCNHLMACHGGVLATLLDVAMARAATTAAADEGTGVVTVEMSTRYLKPGRGPLTAEGKVLHAGRSLCSCEAHVRDESGALVASAMGTFKFMRKKPGAID